MPGTAASQLIFFIAALVVSSVAVGIIFQATDNLRQGFQSKGNSLVDQLNKDIDVINDPGAVPYNATNDTLTLYVMNTGSVNLDGTNTSVTVLINGTAFTNMTVYGAGAGAWPPGTVLSIDVHNVTLPTGQDYSVLVIARGGPSDRFLFRR